MPDKLKILFLLPYPQDVAAGQRFKIEQAFDFLKNQGHSITINSFFGNSTWSILYKKGFMIKKISGTAFSWAKRIFFIFNIYKYDVVYNFMWVTPRGAPVSEWIVRKLSKKLIVDIDDLVYEIDKQNIYKNLLSCHLKSNFLVRNADWVIHNSPFSVQECLKLNNHNRAIHIPCSFDMKRYQPKIHTKKDIVTIGWTGTVSSIPYLKSIEPMLQKLYETKKFKLKLITNFEYQISGLDCETIQWNVQNEIEDLSSFDVGIYPIFFDDWSASKGGLKVQQYMAMGLPSVSTNHGAALSYIEHEKTGYLVNNEQEWIESLLVLIENSSLRSSIGFAARTYAEKNFSINASIKSYSKVICEN